MWLLLVLTLAQQFDSAHVFSKDAAATLYAQRIAGKLASTASVRIVDDKAVRAAAFPPDRIYVTALLIARAANEAELAGVIAHEIAHAQTPPEPITRLDPESGLCARFASMKWPGDTDGRQRERRADEAAIRMLTAAGYDPGAMLAFFNKLRREDLQLPAAFSAEDLLLEKLELEATDHPVKDAVVNTSEFDRVRARMTETPSLQR
jgi:predicted Zn-dependent protease